MVTRLSKQAASNVRAELARRGKSQRDLTQVLHLSRAAVNRRMLGAVSFSIDELDAIARFLDVPITSLISTDVAA